MHMYVVVEVSAFLEKLVIQWLTFSLSRFLRRGMSLALELTDSARLVGQ